LSGLGNTLPVGQAQDLTLTVKDALGNTVTSYTGTVHFSSTDSKALVPGDYTFSAADGGVHSFKGALTFRSAGSQALTITDTANAALSITQAGILVSPAAASSLVLSGLGNTLPV